MELARVHLIEGVGRRVVVVEVALAVGGEAGDGGVLSEERGDVGSAGAFDECSDAVGLKERAPFRGGAFVDGALGAAEIAAAGWKPPLGQNHFFFFR